MDRLGPYKVNTIVVGNCLEVLRQIPSSVFQMCATSPPYWCQRDYGVPPVVYGGDPLCEHEWADKISHPQAKSGKHGPHSTIGAKEAQHQARQANMGQFCLHCNAWLGSLGLEPTPRLYVEHIVEVFREVRRVLRDDGTLWLNMGDSYWGGGGGSYGQGKSAKGREGAHLTSVKNRYNPPGLKPKDLVGIPWTVALALRADGWWLRSDIIWHKTNCMPESVRDRPTQSHECVFLLAKSKRYYYDQDAIREPHSEAGLKRLESPTPAQFGGANKHAGYGTRLASGRPYTEANPAGRNKRTVWTIPTHPFPQAHFATFPPKLVEPMIKAGTSERGACPECGKAWVRVVDKSRSFESGSGKAGNLPVGKHGPGLQGGGATLDVRRGPCIQVTTIGWQPACSCNADDPTPCIVLDPFAGAGTTLMVADGLGRDWLGIEINASYVEMALKRIAEDRKKRAQLELF